MWRILGSQIDLYYNLRNVFGALFILFVMISVIYGVRVHVISILKKYLGIQKRHEIANMKHERTGKKKSTGRFTGGMKTEPIIQSRVDVSRVQTEKLPETEATMLLMQEADQQTAVLDCEENSVETMVLSQEGAPNRAPVIRMEKDIMVVGGEDIE